MRQATEAFWLWLDEYENGNGSDETEPLAVRLRTLLQRPEEREDPRRWDELERWAQRSARQAPRAQDRAAARALQALLEGRTPAPLPPATPSTNGRQPGRRTTAIAVAAVVVLLGSGVGIARAVSTPSLYVVGPAPGAQIGLERVAAVRFSVLGRRHDLREERWTLDGRDVTARVKRSGSKLVFRPTRLDEGNHELVVSRGGGFLGATAHQHIDFAVDLTPPVLRVQIPVRGRAWHPVLLRGTVAEDAGLTVAGRRVPVANGRFSRLLQPPVPRPVLVVATDAAGNQSVESVSVVVAPRRPSVPIRAVHVTAVGWANPLLRKGVLALIAAHRINAVELDLKDEGGIVGFAPGVAAADRIGAGHPSYDLPAAVRYLHGRGIRVIGRLVCFRDPIAARAAWKAGRHDEVVQTPDGRPYAGYGGFTNFASPAVRRYNIAVAVAAARAGVDDILYDYVRRPDGPRSSMVFPGLDRKPAAAIVDFLRETRIALEPYGTYLGASVFGVAATRPDEVAQDVPAIARQVDYVSPMLYPSHWNDGEYGVADPNREPYLIVRRALADFRREVDGTGARLVPWLQDFTLGAEYGPREVRAQIVAARRDGVDEFLLWDPAVIYQAAALTTDAPATPAGLAKSS